MTLAASSGLIKPLLAKPYISDILDLVISFNYLRNFLGQFFETESFEKFASDIEHRLSGSVSTPHTPRSTFPVGGEGGTPICCIQCCYMTNYYQSVLLRCVTALLTACTYIIPDTILQ